MDAHNRNKLIQINKITQSILLEIVDSFCHVIYGSKISVDVWGYLWVKIFRKNSLSSFRQCMSGLIVYRSHKFEVERRKERFIYVFTADSSRQFFKARLATDSSMRMSARYSLLLHCTPKCIFFSGFEKYSKSPTCTFIKAFSKYWMLNNLGYQNEFALFRREVFQ